MPNMLHKINFSSGAVGLEDGKPRLCSWPAPPFGAIVFRFRITASGQVSPFWWQSMFCPCCPPRLTRRRLLASAALVAAAGAAPGRAQPPAFAVTEIAPGIFVRRGEDADATAENADAIAAWEFDIGNFGSPAFLAARDINSATPNTKSLCICRVSNLLSGLEKYDSKWSLRGWRTATSFPATPTSRMADSRSRLTKALANAWIAESNSSRVVGPTLRLPCARRFLSLVVRIQSR